MVDRDAGIVEILKRLSILQESTADPRVITLDINPEYRIRAKQMPAVLLFELDDHIVERSKRDFAGYPCRRRLELVSELWIHNESPKIAKEELVKLYKNVRIVLLVDGGRLLTGVAIREEAMFGPYCPGVPGVLGIGVTFHMVYQDVGLPS
jgi:hypothetical protein